MQYADEAIVVINLKPMKASNGVEDKTKGTSFRVMMTVIVQKARTDAKGRRDFKEYQEVLEAKVKVLKVSRNAEGTISWQ